MDEWKERIIEEVNSYTKSQRFDYQARKRPATGFALQRALYLNGSPYPSFSSIKGEYPPERLLELKTNALINFDYNMAFYERLNREEYNKNVANVLNNYPFLPIYSMKSIGRSEEGIYLLCLDDYKQMYVGIGDMYTRITTHWRKAYPIDRLVFRGVETSRISINSFGIFDTKRIFILPTARRLKMEKIERELIEAIDNDFIANRTVGGGLTGLLEAYKSGFSRKLI